VRGVDHSCSTGDNLDRERSSSTPMSAWELVLMQKHHNCRMTSQDPVSKRESIRLRLTFTKICMKSISFMLSLWSSLFGTLGNTICL